MHFDSWTSGHITHCAHEPTRQHSSGMSTARLPTVSRISQIFPTPQTYQPLAGTHPPGHVPPPRKDLVPEIPPEWTWYQRYPQNRPGTRDTPRMDLVPDIPPE